MSYLSSFLNVWKPPGPPTRVLSNVLLALLRHKVEVGHVGTLDAPAAGVVPLAIGRARLLIPYLPRDDKRYIARVKFGVSHSTGDSTGAVLQTRPWPDELPPDFLRRALQGWIDKRTGKGSGSFTFLQRPHHFSAVWIDGTRSYKLAKRAAAAADVEESASLLSKLKKDLQPKEVTIHSIKLLVDQTCGCLYPEVVIDLHVSSGFFVRSLVEELAEEVGKAIAQHTRQQGQGAEQEAGASEEPFPATLAELTRTSCGVFSSSSVSPSPSPSPSPPSPLSAAHPLYSISWGRLPDQCMPMDQPFAEALDGTPDDNDNGIQQQLFPAAILLGTPATPPPTTPSSSSSSSSPKGPAFSREGVPFDASDLPPLGPAYADGHGSSEKGPLGSILRAVRRFDLAASNGGGSLLSGLHLWQYSKRWPIATMVFPSGDKDIALKEDTIFRVYMLLSAKDQGEHNRRFLSFFPPVSRNADVLKDRLLSPSPSPLGGSADSGTNANDGNDTRMVFLGLAKAVSPELLPSGTGQGMRVALPPLVAGGGAPVLLYLQRLVSVCPPAEEVKKVLSRLQQQ